MSSLQTECEAPLPPDRFIQLVWPLTRRVTCLQMRGAAPSINLLRREPEPPLPPVCLIQVLWPLTARVICLWWIAASTTTLSPTPPFISLLHLGCEALSSRKTINIIIQFHKLWPLTARTTCLWGGQTRGAAPSINLLRPECAPPLPPV